MTDDGQNKSIDVLQAFQSKNHGPPLPNPQALHPSTNQDSDVSNPDNNDNNDNNSNVKPMLKKRACHQMKDPTPQSLGYYPPGWKSILIQAKWKWQYHIVIKNPFPDCEDHLHEAEIVLLGAIEDYQACGRIRKDGMIVFQYSVLYANYCLDFNMDHDMTILVSISILLNHGKIFPKD